MRPVFLAGPGRSGTTVARRALAKHPEVAALGREFRLIADPGGLLDLVESLREDRWDPYSADRAIEEFLGVAYALGGLSADRYAGYRFRSLPYLALDLLDALGAGRTISGSWTGAPKRSWMNHYRPLPLGVIRREVRDFVDSFYERETGGESTTVLVDDTPYAGLRWRRIERVWPGADFVLCVRHPLDVLASHLRGGYDWTPDDPEVAATRILDVIRGALSAVPYLLRLEDVVEGPREAMEDLCAFVGLSPPPRAAWEVYDAAHANLGRRDRDLTRTERAVGEAILGDVARDLGYGP